MSIESCPGRPFRRSGEGLGDLKIVGLGDAV